MSNSSIKQYYKRIIDKTKKKIKTLMNKLRFYEDLLEKEKRDMND